MAQYRVQVATYLLGSLAADEIVNTFYLDTDAMSGADDPAALNTDAATLFSTFRLFPSGAWRVRSKIYNMSHAKPRQPLAESIKTPTSLSGNPVGPREVALCLSYYAGRNLPRLRGRMFIGPYNNGQMSERPDSTARNELKTLALGLSALGGINVQWVQYSPTSADFTNVSNYWIDDEWDTMRSRGLEATTRTTGTVSG